MSCMRVHIFMWEGTEHSVFHIHGLQPSTGPVTTVCWCHCLPLCSCVPSWCSELQQVERFAMWITFAASRQWSHNTERGESSAGTDRLLTNEGGGTVRAARRAARQLHDRTSAKSIIEWRDHEMTWEQCLQVCYKQMLPVCVTGTQGQKPSHWQHLLVSDLILTRTGEATCFVLLTRGWKSVPSKQCNVKITLLCSCYVLLFKFARMFHVELRGEFFLDDGLQKSDVSDKLFRDFFRRFVSHLWLCIDGGTGSLCDVTFAPHSPFSYCPGWSRF